MSPKPTYKLRNVRLTDAPAILDIYRYFITDSTLSFEVEVPTTEEIQRRIQNTFPKYPWLICESEDGSIAGYAYATEYKVREAYQWIAETSIYLSSDYRGCGIGSLLYEKLFEIMKAQGYFYAFAGISGEKPGSVDFHEKMGFTCIGEWPNCGNKFGKWCKVSSYTKTLKELEDNPQKPVPYSEIMKQIMLN